MLGMVVRTGTLISNSRIQDTDLNGEGVLVGSLAHGHRRANIDTDSAWSAGVDCAHVDIDLLLADSELE